MFKPALAATGELQAPIGVADTVLYVDIALANAVMTAIGLTDFTYLILEEAGKVEAVKVTAAELSFLTVERAKEGTTAQVFAAGATLRYELISEVVSDLVDARLAALGIEDTLTFTINSPHTVVRELNEVGITIVPLTLTSEDGTIDITGESPNLDIAVQRGAFGCCDE